MCWCRPEVRTPCCGGVDCHPSAEDQKKKQRVLLQKKMEDLITSLESGETFIEDYPAHLIVSLRELLSKER